MFYKYLNFFIQNSPNMDHNKMALKQNSNYAQKTPNYAWEAGGGGFVKYFKPATE